MKTYPIFPTDARGRGRGVKVVHGSRLRFHQLERSSKSAPYTKFNSLAGCHVLYHDLNLLYCSVNSIVPVTGCPAVYSDWNQHYLHSTVDCQLGSRTDHLE